MGNSLSTLLLADVGGQNTLVSGEGLAYLSGELEYTNDRPLRRAAHLLLHGQPFFMLSEVDAVNSIASLTHCDAVPNPKLRLSTHCVVLVTANYKGVPAVLRIGGCDEARSEVLRQVHGLEVAASDPRLRDLVPHFVAHFSGENNREVLIESKLAGAPAEFSWERVNAITNFWMESKPSGNPARPNLSAELTQLCESLPSERDSLYTLRDPLLAWHSRTRMRADVAHGDLWLGNALFSGDTVTGIVDWEWAHADGMRLVDILHLLFMSYSAFHDTSIGSVLRQFWGDAIADPGLKDSLTRLSMSMGLDQDDLKFAALLLWFDYLRQRAIRGRMPSQAWSKDMITCTAPIIAKWLTRRTGETLATAT
jgi:thiamine kinase-like enzyme